MRNEYVGMDVSAQGRGHRQGFMAQGYSHRLSLCVLLPGRNLKDYYLTGVSGEKYI